MTQETVIEKIKKLIAKAKGTDNEQEANAFMAKANTLLIKHGLAMGEVVNDDKKESAVYEGGIVFGGSSSEGLWEDLLISVLSVHNLCEAIILTEQKTITLIGREENIEVTKYMYDVARDIMRKNRLSRYKEYKKETQEIYSEYTEKELYANKIMKRRDSFARSYLKGSVSGLHIKLTLEREQLVEQKKAAERKASMQNQDQGSIFELALQSLIETRKDENKELKDSIFGKVKQAQTKLKNNIASQLGQEDGKNIQLNPGLTAGDETNIPKLLN